MSLIIGFVYVVLFSPLFKVRSIAVRGNQQLTTEELKKQTQAILSASFLGSNSLFVNPDEIGKRLKTNNYQLENVQVERRLLGGILVTVSEQRATLQWRSGSSVFVLSGNGKAYAQLDNLDKGLPVVEDSTNLPVRIGQKVVPSSFVAFVQKVDPQLASLGLQSTNKSVAETTTELYVKTNKGYVIKLDTTRSLESQISDLRAVLAKKISPSEYVDLRIAGRVFYK
jgi:cell division septal protein FtsQ